MSLKALSWAGDQRCERPADKLILLGMAQCHNPAMGDLYPSVMWLSEFSGLDRKTVLKSLERLRESGQLIDTGRRVGRGVIVYRFAFDDNGSGPESGTATSTKNGTANDDPDAGSGPTFSRKQSQKRDEYQSQKRDIEPVRGTCKGNGDHSAGAHAPRTPGAPAHARDARTRGCQLPTDFAPVLTEAAERTVRAWPPGMLEREVQQFRDHHTAKGTTFKDWQAALRTWIANADKWRNKDGGNHRSRDHRSSNGLFDAAVDSIAQREGRDLFDR